MTNVLLVIIMIMALIIMISSIITMVVVSSESKNKNLIYKTLKITGIILLVVLIIGAAVGASFIKKSDSNHENAKVVTLETAGFNEVTIDEYLSLIKESEKNVILVARPTCSFCEKFTPILKKAMDELKIKVNYIDTDKFSEEDWESFNNSFSFFTTTEWGTPLVLITQNGELIAENQGYTELDGIKTFFKNNGIGE